MTDADPGQLNTPADVASPGQRPTVVTAAAVLALILAFYELMSGFVITGAVMTVPGAGALGWALGPLHFILGALLLWGAVTILRGGSETVALYTAIVAAIAITATAIMKAIDGVFPWSVLFLAAFIVLIVLLRMPPSQEYFAQKRTTAAQ